MPTRLSRKAQDEVERLLADLSGHIRSLASNMADGKEFAGVPEVRKAYRAAIIATSAGMEFALGDKRCPCPHKYE